MRLDCRALDAQHRVLLASQCFPGSTGCLRTKHVMGPAHFPGEKTEARQTLRQCVCVGKEGRGWGGAGQISIKGSAGFCRRLWGKISFPCPRGWDDAWRMFLVLSKYLRIPGAQGEWDWQGLSVVQGSRAGPFWWHVLRMKCPEDPSSTLTRRRAYLQSRPNPICFNKPVCKRWAAAPAPCRPGWTSEQDRATAVYVYMFRRSCDSKSNTPRSRGRASELHLVSAQ